MRPRSLLGLCLVVASGAGCHKEPSQAGPAPKAGAELPAQLQGNYVEGSPDSADRTEHRVEARHWTQLDSGAPTPVKVQVLQHVGLPGGISALLLDYKHPSSQESRRIRADLWLESEGTLWLCRHPELKGQDALNAAPGNRGDLLGQGCFGAPWRKLQRQAKDAQL